jgi:hypothetical protein
MRKIFLSLLVLLLCFSANAQEYDYCAGAGGAAASPETWGNTTTTGCSATATTALAKLNVTATYTSVSAGTITKLETWMKSGGTSKGNFRMSLYDTSNNLICQHSAEVTILSTESTFDWKGDSQALTGTCTVSASTNYRIAISYDSTNTHACVDSVTSGDFQYLNTDYTGGFPASISPDTNSTTSYHFRVTVQP